MKNLYGVLLIVLCSLFLRGSFALTCPTGSVPITDDDYVISCDEYCPYDGYYAKVDNDPDVVMFEIAGCYDRNGVFDAVCSSQ